MAVENGVIEIESDKRIALLIAILALFLAIFETGAKSAQTEAISQNVEATNLWAFYQARTVRQTTVRTAADAAELQKAAATDPAARAAIEAQQKAWRDQATGWESNKVDGRKELTEKAHATEEGRERSMAKYHFYEYAAALLQVAIVIASASIITSIPPLALLSILLAVGGVALGGIGFFAPQMVHL